MKTVALFGSARPTPDMPIYQETEAAARLLVENGWTVATGGGPGLMEAANKGALGVCENGVCSLGYSIFLPFEAETNEHVQDDTHHQNFFTRLQQFTNDCDAFIALPGGYGTQLEILTVVQLLQVEHMVDKPLILVGDMWAKLMRYTAAHLHANGYISDAEKVFWRYAKTPEEAAKLLI